MKIWITRRSAFQIQVSGLSRLDVWFQKPLYYLHYITDEMDLPFGSLKEFGCRDEGWGCHGGRVQQSVSFHIFGYDDREEGENEISRYVWEKLCEHFGNTEFDKWHVYENEGNCHIKDFLLEIDLTIKKN